MIVPGSNLLNMALGVIGSQLVDYFTDVSRAPDAAGRLVTTRTAVTGGVRGSFQPLDDKSKAVLGLDMAESWATFYAPHAVIDPSRDHSGDQLEYFGRRYQVKGKTDWQAQDGWTRLLCVDIGAASE